MPQSVKRRFREIRKMIETELGFTLVRIRQVRGGHIRCRVQDDAGNRFLCFTGESSCNRSALRNFKQDVRRQSNKCKGLIG